MNVVQITYNYFGDEVIKLNNCSYARKNWNLSLDKIKASNVKFCYTVQDFGSEEHYNIFDLVSYVESAIKADREHNDFMRNLEQNSNYNPIQTRGMEIAAMFGY